MTPDEEALLSVTTILNSLNALVYVADMQTYEMIFMNDYGTQAWGQWQGKRCWQVLQAGQAGPCSFCTNKRLTGPDGQSTGVVEWEFQNTVTGRWFHCQDRTIPWVDGRIVRMEIAFDISKRKQLEVDLQTAREEAERLALIDPLTGLKNRRAFFATGGQMFKQAQRFGQPLCQAMIDIDHFKLINDYFGHAGGDAVLQRIAGAIAASLRDADLVARLGGDEFCVLLPVTVLGDALGVCERIRQAVENLNLGARPGEPRISCSIGLTSLAPHYRSLDEMVSDADRAMYSAKSSGRNRVENLRQYL